MKYYFFKFLNFTKMESESVSNISEEENYFNGELTDKDHKIKDISYSNWVESDDNIKKLCTAFNVTPSSSYDVYSKILKQHDHSCELKLLKWITEDDEHKEKFVKISKSSNKLNRYPKILPYNFNAVSVNGEDKKETSENNYINASFINGPFKEDEKMFIATQGPLPGTLASFWKMIISHKVSVIIMLANVKEEGRDKSEMYWPATPGTSKIIPKQSDTEEDIEIKFLSESAVIANAFFMREFLINDKIKVTHLHVICWPDHNVPNEDIGFGVIDTLINILNEYKEANPGAPVVIHCSAGVGRTGTFIAIYNIIKCLKSLLKKKKTDSHIIPFFNVFNVVRKLREQRFSMISDTSQYKLIYQFCLEWIQGNFK